MHSVGTGMGAAPGSSGPHLPIPAPPLPGPPPSSSAGDPSGLAGAANGASYPGEAANPTAGGPPFPVPYAAGWNIIAVTSPGHPFANAGPVFTLQAGDDDYETIAPEAPLQPRVGYWVDLPQDTPSIIIPTNTCQVVVPQSDGTSTCEPADVCISLPAGQWVMIGNPYLMPISITGADAMYTYDPVAGYEPTTKLEPGRGAFAYSAAGGTATIHLPSV
jgi:hypothetical protein